MNNANTMQPQSDRYIPSTSSSNHQFHYNNSNSSNFLYQHNVASAPPANLMQTSSNSSFSSLSSNSHLYPSVPSSATVNMNASSSLYPTLPKPQPASSLYSRIPTDQNVINQQLYNVPSQKQSKHPSSLPIGNSSSNSNSSNFNNNYNSSNQKKKKKHQQQESSAKIIYDSSAQLISGISNYVKSIPWSNLAKQFNENILQPYVSSIGNGIASISNSDIHTTPSANGILTPYFSNLGELISCELMFLPVVIEQKESAMETTDERLFMVLAFSNGFQIFDVHEPNNVREIITKTCDDWVTAISYPQADENTFSNAVVENEKFEHAQIEPTTLATQLHNISEESSSVHEENDNIQSTVEKLVSSNEEDTNHESSSFDLDYVKTENHSKNVNKKQSFDMDEWYEQLANRYENEDNHLLESRNATLPQTEPSTLYNPTTLPTTLPPPELILEDHNLPIPMPHLVSEPVLTYPPVQVPPSKGPVKMVMLLTKPSKKAIKRSEKRAKLSNNNASWLSYYPMVSLVVESEPNTVHFYSLKYNCFLDDHVTITCRNENSEQPPIIFQMLPSEEAFIITDSSGQIFFYDPCTFELVSQGICFPSITCLQPASKRQATAESESKKKKKTQQSNKAFGQLYGGVIAVRKRFVAFASNTEVLNPVLDFTTKVNSTFTEKSWEVAKKAATGIYKLGDYGFKKASKYWFEGNNGKKKHNSDGSDSDSNDSSSKDSTDEDEEEVSLSTLWSGDLPPELAGYERTVGTVEIRDLKTNKVLLHFRAHNEPIAAMAFDRTGTLLCTAPLSGKYLNVFQILPDSGGDMLAGEKNIKLLYRLYRGFTTAHIQDIHFSVNSKWVAACSARGTIHIYAINPTGGPVDPRFHFNGEQYIQSGSPSEGIILNVVARIHDPTSGARKNLLGKSFIHTRSVFQIYTLSEFKIFNRLSTNDDTSEIYYDHQNINNENILVTLNSGILSYYVLKPQLKKKEKATDNLSKTTIGTASSGVSVVSHVDRTQISAEDFELNLSVELLARFDIFLPDTDSNDSQDSPTSVPNFIRNQFNSKRNQQQSISWASLYGKFSDKVEPTHVSRFVDEKQDTLSKWISNVELETYAQPLNPLWATGHFKFRTIKTNIPNRIDNKESSTFDITENGYNQINDISKSLMIKVSNPIPIHKFDNEAEINIPKQEIIDSKTILKAISTPMSATPVESTQANVTQATANAMTLKKSNSPKISPRRSPNISNLDERHVSIANDIESEEEVEEVSSQEEETVESPPKNNSFPTSSIFGLSNIVPPSQATTQPLRSNKDLREDNLLYFSHMDNYFDNAKNKTPPTVPQSSGTTRGNNNENQPLTENFSLSSSIHQDYFHDEEEPKRKSSELELRKQFLQNINLRESINVNHLQDSEEEEEEVDDYFRQM